MKPRREEIAAHRAAYQTSHRAAYQAVYQATYKASHKEEIAATRAAYQATYDLKYRAAHPDRVKARRALSSAIRSGKRVRGPCEWCNRQPEIVSGVQVVQAHHHRGYAKERWLDVQWLCSRCHGAAHRVAA